MPDIVTNKQHLVWCQSIWDGCVDGGVWMVPRSGLIFQKSAILKRMTLIERMPWTPEMGGSAEDLRLYQDADFEAIAKRFALIGVEFSL
jgi:hypothetical protein